jgi:site-specific recombinase XerD
VKVKRARNPVTGLVLYVVTDDHSRPIKPIMDFLTYLEKKEYSPNTLKTYAHALANFWSYLKTRNVSDWTDIDLLVLSGFVHYLRMPTTGVEPIRGYVANRLDSTINLYISASHQQN